MILVPKLDYTLESPEERLALVNQIIEENPELTPNYMEALADYLILCMEKQERKEKKVLTDNRLATVNKRETSFEGLVSQLENGEDGIYNLMNENKNTIFQPRISITQEDLDTIPYLEQLRSAINTWDAALRKTSGRDAFTIKKALIEMRKDQYVIKQAYQRPIIPAKLTRSVSYFTPLDDESYLNEDNEVVIKGVSFMDPKVVSAILCNYSKLKEDSYDRFDGDTWYLIQAFEEICDKALEDFPLYMRLVEYKIDGMQNADIKDKLQEEFGISHSPEYISSLWRNKIPKLIAAEAERQFLNHQFKELGLPFKKCSKCGQLKPAHNTFFSINNTSKDGWYSICKVCRNQKHRALKDEKKG